MQEAGREGEEWRGKRKFFQKWEQLFDQLETPDRAPHELRLSFQVA